MSATDFITENKSIFAISVSTIALIALISTIPPVYAQEPFVGEIKYFAFNFPPRGWALCDGQILPINQNQALFSLLGNTYGGVEGTSFGLPDMRGRIPLHFGNGHTLGERAGTESVTLDSTHIPSHAHGLNGKITAQLSAVNSVGDSTSSSGNALGLSFARVYSTLAPTVVMHQDSIMISGDTDVSGGVSQVQSHENRPPFVVLSCNIALQGTFPSRN